VKYCHADPAVAGFSISETTKDSVQENHSLPTAGMNDDYFIIVIMLSATADKLKSAKKVKT